MKSHWVRTVVSVLTLVSLSACGSSSSNGGSSSNSGSGTASGSEQPAASKDIVDTAVAAGSFRTLAQALQSAELVGVLKSAGPFTVFAPTDEAFNALPAGTVESLLRPENRAKLQAILKYHVVSGAVSSSQARSLTSATSVQGSALSIQASSAGVKVGGANVVRADIQCSNGVIHVIDRVLIPPGI